MKALTSPRDENREKMETSYIIPFILVCPYQLTGCKQDQLSGTQGFGNLQNIHVSNSLTMDKEIYREEIRRRRT